MRLSDRFEHEPGQKRHGLARLLKSKEERAKRPVNVLDTKKHGFYNPRNSFGTNH